MNFMNDVDEDFDGSKIRIQKCTRVPHRFYLSTMDFYNEKKSS